MKLDKRRGSCLCFRMLKLARQGDRVVARDSNGKVVGSSIVTRDASKKTWRRMLKEMTNDGRDVMLVLCQLAKGDAYTVKHGEQESEPIIPSPEVRRAAAVDLLHFLHGKPVAQTEVAKADEVAEEMVQYRAMDEDALRRIISLADAEEKRKGLTGDFTSESEASFE